jgi:hypothetical protein
MLFPVSNRPLLGTVQNNDVTRKAIETLAVSVYIIVLISLLIERVGVAVMLYTRIMVVLRSNFDRDTEYLN